ncbi:MAG: hypothetical protein RSA29_08115 [Clostridium sp.]|uniref:Ppx/GppA phosphatase family protein n=1 Tax=Clostridium sp. TaxID=1506 RepID=UPI003052175A
MNNIGIIDIGSNTIHLLIVNIDNKYNIKILEKDKEHLRLGAALSLDKNISQEKIGETITIIKRYLRSCIINNVSNIIAVATEAFRAATNSDYILHLIKKHTGLSINILSQGEEAYLSYLGVTTVCNIKKGIIMDTGGNSTELISVENNKFKNYVSIPLGAINITEKINVTTSGKYLSCDYDTAYFTNLFSSTPWLKSFSGTSLIGIGGTFKNIRRIYNNNTDSLLNPNSSFTSISNSNIQVLCNHIKNIDLKERKKLKGLSKKRGDIVLGGCEIITQLIAYCNFEEITLCDEGLRTGILQNYINQ